jgi:hypothetical protein
MGRQTSLATLDVPNFTLLNEIRARLSIVPPFASRPTSGVEPPAKEIRNEL